VHIVGAVLERSGSARPFAESRPFTVSAIELDEPAGDELLVRIEAASVCHSDLSGVDGSRPRPLPMLLGHEAAGIVERIGEGEATRASDIAVGDRVVMTFLPRCGECPECATDGRLPCRFGAAANGAGTLLGGGTRLHRTSGDLFHHLGVSAFASHAVVNVASVVRVDADVPAPVAALLGRAVLTGGGAVINAGQPEAGEPVMVVGLGGVGMAALLVAIAFGHPVIAVDALNEKLDLARELGASETYTPAALAESGRRAPVVIEAAGSARAFETAFAATEPGGRTVTVGLPSPDARVSLSPLTLTAEARTVIGSYLGSAVASRDIPRYVDLWRAGRLPVERLISSQIGLSELDAAMDRLASGSALRQVIVFPEGTTV
jgi:Zn-dependent alcohol dehydrogenase